MVLVAPTWHVKWRHLFNHTRIPPYPPSDLFMNLRLRKDSHHLLTLPSSPQMTLTSLFASACLNCNKYALTCSNKIQSTHSISLPASLDDLGGGNTEFSVPNPSSPITANLSLARMFSKLPASDSLMPSLNLFKHSWIKSIP
jgi:hypothetical protein